MNVKFHKYKMQMLWEIKMQQVYQYDSKNTFKCKVY